MSFQHVCAVADIREDEPLAVTVDGLDLAVARCAGDDGEEVFALQDLCSHAEVALSEGEVTAEPGSCQVECWLHGSRFDLRTGKPTGPPATEPVAVFPVEVRDQDVYVDITRTLNGVTPS